MNISTVLPTRGNESGWPTAPRLYAELFQAFERGGVAWCYWKSVRRLDDVFTGAADLDVLVLRTDRQAAVKALVDCGFKHAPDAPGRDDPAIMSFLGHDEGCGALLHVHVHFRLVLGPPLFKNDRLACEAAFLGRSRLFSGCNLRLLAAEDAALLLFIRAKLEYGRFDPVQIRRRPQIEQKFRQDFAELAPVIDLATLRRAAGELFDADLAARIAAAIAGDPIASPAVSRREIARALSRGRIYGGVEAGLRGGWRTLVFLVGAFNRRFLEAPRIWGRRAPGGGAVIALVGVDGSGKSTATSNIRGWLGPEVDVVKTYFGTGDGAPSLLLAPFKAAGGLVARFVKTKPKGASHGRISDKPPGPIYATMFAIWAVAVALDKRHKLILVQRAARRGFIVVTDRYPQNEIENFNDGPLLHRLPWVPAWLRRFEQSIYMGAHRTPPDLIIKLHVGPETVLRREPEMNPALVDERIACLVRLRFPGAEIVSIDARAPLAEVSRSIKSAIWAIL